MPYKDQENRKQFLKAYRERNKEKIKESNHKYYKNNLEKFREYNKEKYREKHPNAKPFRGRPPATPEQKLISKINMRKSRKAYARRKYLEKRQWLWEYRSSHPCQLCQESHPACITFHHRDPAQKSFDIHKYYHKSMTTIIAEIAKCDILCFNCHMKHHYNERSGEN